jgi:hypothetical protein
MVLILLGVRGHLSHRYLDIRGNAITGDMDWSGLTALTYVRYGDGPCISLPWELHRVLPRIKPFVGGLAIAALLLSLLLLHA